MHNHYSKKQVRPLIIHGHIFKNAGSTFDWSLERNFGKGFCDHRDNDPMVKIGAPYLAEYIENNRHISAISSHHMCNPLPVIESATLYPVFIIRHPIERILSVYNFERIQRENTPGAMAAKKYNFKDYVKWRMAPNSGPTIRNYQVRYCTGAKKRGAHVTKAAFNNLIGTDSYHVTYGVVDKFDESMVVIEQKLKCSFPALDLSYIRQNVMTKHNSAGVLEMAENVLNDLGVLGDEVMMKNRFDLLFYDWSKRRLAHEFSMIENADELLHNFRVRCKSLQYD